MIHKLLLLLLFITPFNLTELNAAKNAEISVIVFDFGGVIAEANTTKMSDFLMNSFHFDKDSLSVALRNMQIYISKGGSEKEYWEEYARFNEIDLPNDWIDQWGAVIKESLSEIPGTIEIVKALQAQGYQTAMLSDVTEYQAEIVRKMGYYDLFNPVLLSYAIGVKKPNPEAFKILLNTLQKPASEVIFIDDRAENVNAAIALGIDSIQFKGSEQLKKELLERGVESLHGLTL